MNEETQLEVAPERRMTIDEVRDSLGFIRELMSKEMKDGSDYGKVPGCGDKPGLFQPGAQKLMMTFRLTDKVRKEELRDIPHPSVYGHREYAFTIALCSATGKEWDGVGTCSTLEQKYRYRAGSRKCPQCHKETVFKDKKGPGYYCWAKKGGCGTQFTTPTQIQSIENQSIEKVEHENPADFWNTVRKMAFKRALVHAAINATNTSELWSQDLEDLPQANREEYIPEATPADEPELPPQKPAPKAPTREPSNTAALRMRALNVLQAAPGQPNRATFEAFLLHRGWIDKGEQCEAWQEAHVPKNKAEMEQVAAEVAQFDIDRHQASEVVK